MSPTPNNGEYYEADDDEYDQGVSDEEVVEASINEQEDDAYFDENEEFADDGQNNSPLPHHRKAVYRPLALKTTKLTLDKTIRALSNL